MPLSCAQARSSMCVTFLHQGVSRRRGGEYGLWARTPDRARNAKGRDRRHSVALTWSKGGGGLIMADTDTLSWSYVHEAISAIAARCDGAHAPDGVGFDGSDTHFGRRVAMIPVQEWTPEIAQACYELVVHKYRTQAESYGIVVANLQDPGFHDLDPRAARRHARELAAKRDTGGYGLIDADGENLTVHTAKVNWSVLDIVRAQPGRRFDSEGKRWLVPVSARAGRALFEMAEQYDLEVSAEARSLVERAGTGEGEERNDRRIALLPDGRASVCFEYDPGLVTEVKRLSGAKWVGAEKYWRVGVDAPLIAFGEAHGFFIDEPVSSAARTAVEQAKRLSEQSRSVESDLVVPGLRGELRPFQRAGVAYALSARRVLIGDAMGLGKTIQGLGVIQAVGGAGPAKALVVCPASLKLNWLAEAIKWLGSEWQMEVVSGRKAGRIGKTGSSHELVICNYDLLAARAEDLVAFSPNVLVADEIHAAKNKGALRTKALDKIAKSVPGDGYVVGLSGTPVVNRPIELASPLSILGRLDDLGGFWHFAKRYCKAYHNGFGWDFSGASNLEELNEVLRKTCYVRRTVHDVYDELPPVQVASVPLGMDRDIAKQYAQAERDIVAHMAERAAALAYMAAEAAADAALLEAKAVAKAIYDDALAEADLVFSATTEQARAGIDEERAVRESEVAAALRAYEEARSLAQAGYDEALAEANARYEGVVSPAWDEYSLAVESQATSPAEEAAQSGARSLYEEIKTGARAVFDGAVAVAQKSYAASTSGPWAAYREAADALEEEGATSTTGEDVRLSAQAAYDAAIADAEAAHSAAMESVGGESAGAAAEARRRAAAAEMLVKMNELRQLAARGKLAGVIEWIQNFLEAGDEKLVVFAWHKEIQEALATNLGGVAIMGGQSPAETKSAVDAFQNNPSVRIITCSLRAGSEGHTLTAAQNVAFVEEPWTPGNVAQAVARCYGRLNDPHGVVAWHLVAAGTIDEDMVDLIASKAEVTNQVADGKDAEKTTAVSGILDRIAKRRQGDVKSVPEQAPVAKAARARVPQSLRAMAGLEPIGANARGASLVGADDSRMRQAEAGISY